MLLFGQTPVWTGRVTTSSFEESCCVRQRGQIHAARVPRGRSTHCASGARPSSAACSTARRASPPCPPTTTPSASPASSPASWCSATPTFPLDPDLPLTKLQSTPPLTYRPWVAGAGSLGPCQQRWPGPAAAPLAFGRGRLRCFVRCRFLFGVVDRVLDHFQDRLLETHHVPAPPTCMSRVLAPIQALRKSGITLCPAFSPVHRESSADALHPANVPIVLGSVSTRSPFFCQTIIHHSSLTLKQ